MTHDFFSLCVNFFDAHRANNGIKGSHTNWQGLCRIVHLSSQPLHGTIQLNYPFCFFMDFAIYVIGVDQPWGRRRESFDHANTHRMGTEEASFPGKNWATNLE